MTTQMIPICTHQTLQNVDLLADFAEKPTEKPTEKCSVSVSVSASVRFRFFFSTTETNRLCCEKTKTDRGHFRFRFTTLAVRRALLEQHYFGDCGLPGTRNARSLGQQKNLWYDEDSVHTVQSSAAVVRS